jgi:hypothetical protein
MSNEDIMKLILGLVPGLIAGIFSLVLAFWSVRLSRATQREIETLKAQLVDESAEKKALRDYQYDARKRLYQECEPLLFQLTEQSEEALRRIENVAKAARSGGLDKENWLADEGYYLQSMLYRLFSPLVFYSLLRRRITSIDLSLDNRIKTYYQLAKTLYNSFSEDYELAGIEPRIEHYSRTVKGGQGINWGYVSNAVEALIVYDEKLKKERCKSFSEFLAEYKNRQSDLYDKFVPAKELFLNFHPGRKPVLWRVLILQAHLYRFFSTSSSSHELTQQELDNLIMKPIPEAERIRLYWLPIHRLTAEEKQLMNEPFEVAERYLRKYLASADFS